MNWLKKLRAPLLFLPLLLTACEPFGPPTNGVIKYNLANVPPDIRLCFTQVTGKPAAGSMTEKQAAALIAALRISEVGKNGCGRRLLALYDRQALPRR